MRFRFLLFLSWTVAFLPNVLFAGIGGEAEAILRQVFPDADGFEFSAIELDQDPRLKSERIAGQQFNIEKLYLWRIVQAGELVGTAVLDNVLGKVQPITYMVIFNAEYTVTNVRIIRYREQQGGAIQNTTWLDQFIGFRADSGFTLGEDIDGITGATLSANAITRGIKRVTVYLSLLNSAAAMENQN